VQSLSRKPSKTETGSTSPPSPISFGEIPVLRGAFYNSRIAPDFAVPDRTGKLVHLSDFRGKKALVITWASWWGCRLDLPGWQKLYTELHDKNFEIIAAAQDTGGEAAAGKRPINSSTFRWASGSTKKAASSAPPNPPGTGQENQSANSPPQPQ
jgi:hypothetical protein